ncbi:MAG: hypothetical protein M1819_005380 [Sarea resinae]|nr:MAG: hypothetical protein M1819_005380 [Sarea resinae]
MAAVTVLVLSSSIVQLIDATTKAVKYINAVKNAPKDRATLACEASSLLVLFTKLRYRVEDAKSAEPWFDGVRSLGLGGGPLDQFRKTMEELARKLKPDTRMKNLGKTLIWPLEKSDTKGILSGIERMKRLVSIALVGDLGKLAQEVNSNLGKVDENAQRTNQRLMEMPNSQKDRKFQEIVAWISPLSFYTEQNDFLARRQEGTGEWLIRTDAFQDWPHGSDRTLYCSGHPGAGKTIFTSIAVNHLQQHLEKDDIAIAYAYCSYKDRENQSAANLIASLLQQLVRKDAVLSDEIVSLYNRHLEKGTRPGLNDWSKLLRAEVGRFSMVFIAIDALDEIPESNGARDSFISEVESLQATVHLLFTSRHIQSIKHRFEEARRLEICAGDEDVKTYVDSRIDGERSLLCLVNSDPALRATIANIIVEKAQGMFLLAQLHMNALAKEHDRRTIRLALENLPKELDTIYERAMERIRSQDEEDTRLAESVLSWISYTLRPMTILELQHALATTPGDKQLDEEAFPDERLMLSVCAGLVAIDWETNIIRLVHYTAQEYLERIRMTQFPQARVNIAATCLKYTSIVALQREPCYDYRARKTCISHHPFIEYAAQHLADHARGDPEEIIGADILKFFNCHLTREFLIIFITNKSLFRFGGAYIPLGPLHVVSFLGLATTAKKLLDKGAKVDFDAYVHTPLFWAAAGGHVAVAKLLIRYNAALDLASDEDDRTPLSKAAGDGNLAMVEYLHARGANIHSRDKSGRTPSCLAARFGHLDILKFLCEKGSEISPKDY